MNYIIRLLLALVGALMGFSGSVFSQEMEQGPRREEFDLRPRVESLRTQKTEPVSSEVLPLEKNEVTEEPRREDDQQESKDATLPEHVEPQKTVVQSQKTFNFVAPAKKLSFDADTIDFTFNEANLSEVVNRYAEKRGINFIMPQGTQSISQKITFKAPHRFSLEEAERYMYLFLDLGGYSVRPGPSYSIVMKNDQNARRHPLPLYINVAPKELPDSEELIRAVYYLNNLQVPENPNNPQNAVVAILGQLLSTQDVVTVDPQSNGVIITDKSRNIRTAMQLIYELDAAGSPYVVETVQLFNSSASYVASFLKTKMIGSAGQDRQQTMIGSYFSQSLHIVPDDRRNTLIIMGKDASVNRLKQFIKEEIDSPTERGNSIFHVYDLKYRDAQKLADVLTSVVQGTSQQDQFTTQRASGGPRRFFEGVVIKAEVPQAVQPGQQTQVGQPGGDQLSGGGTPAGGSSYRGANRLLVAAKPSDWAQLEKLIERLDVPQRQVILEVLIVDYTRRPTKQITSRLRNPTSPSSVQLPEGVQAQSAQDPNKFPDGSQVGIIPKLNTNNIPIGIDGDLLRLLVSTDPETTGTVINSAPPGSLVLSFNDPSNTGIFGLIQLLNSIGKTKVLSHPYLIVLDNVTATVYNSDIRRNVGEGAGISGGVRVNIEDIPAILKVGITPRISSAERLSLDISVDITQFIAGGSTLNRTTRTLNTNANLGSGQLLVLGGLTQTEKTELMLQTPILGQIPLLGWLFRSTKIVTTELELGIFIRPTILEPKLQDSANKYTQEKMRTSLSDEVDIEGNPQDPIVRLFFNADKQSEVTPESMNAYFTGQDLSQTQLTQPTRGRVRGRRRKCYDVMPKDPALQLCNLGACSPAAYGPPG